MLDGFEMPKEETPDPKLKGVKGGNCNITACQKPNAIYYNHGSMAWYCPSCAKRLNADPYNKADAMKMFGHDLCTLNGDTTKLSDHEIHKKETDAFMTKF